MKDSGKNPLTGAHYLYNAGKQFLLSHIIEINKDFMLGHAKSSEIMLFDSLQALKTKNPVESPDAILLFDFKNLREIEKGFRIYSIKVNYMKPSFIFVTCSMGVFIMLLGPQINTIPNIITNPFYTTYITPLQVLITFILCLF